jgi:NADH:ubiquinone oxidoreductase subunit 3 (subunit A)
MNHIKITIILSTVVIILATSISKKNYEDREKKTFPFECGFDPETSA